MNAFIKCGKFVFNISFVFIFGVNQIGFNQSHESLKKVDQDTKLPDISEKSNLDLTPPQDKFTPPNITKPTRFNPDSDEIPSVIPDQPSSDVEFSVNPDQGSVQQNGTITYTVVVTNYSKNPTNNLVYSDTLDQGWTFVPDAKSGMTLNKGTQQLALSIPTIQPGQTYTFSYKLKPNGFNKSFTKGEVRIRKARISSSDKKVDLTENLAAGVNVPNLASQSEMAVVEPENDWYSFDKEEVYLPGGATKDNSVLVSSPVNLDKNGPAYQFKLEVIGTGTITKDNLGVAENQQLGIQKVEAANFNQPAYIKISMDGIADLKHLDAGYEPYVATYDESNKVWVKVPILKMDPSTNSVYVQAAHFSVWGAGLGTSLPQNGANVLLFDKPYTSLFTGSSRYSIPIWTPSGRAGLSPDIALSYSSGTLDGVLGEVQAPWVGAGWNIDGAEIVRKITTSASGYGYANEFTLSINGTSYNLIVDASNPSRYYTKQGSFLLIERNNVFSGDYQAPANTSGESWRVVTTDGTEYRFGWNTDSEQMALMTGYSCSTGTPCITPAGAYASLGYAGTATNMVALRWRVDQIRDTHNNILKYSYSEEHGSGSTAYDRASYLSSIGYAFNGNDPGYEVAFDLADRSTVGDGTPPSPNAWDNYDTKFLDRIRICQHSCGSGTQIRQYDLNYALATVPDANGTLTLSNIVISGGGYSDNGQNIPATTSATISMAYSNMDNRAVSNGSKPYAYPRLTEINNGYGGKLSYTYGTDGRGTDSWYDYRVNRVTVSSGAATTNVQGYSYATPVYTGIGSNASLGELIGYQTNTETTYQTDGTTKIGSTVHTFGISGLDIGYELSTVSRNSSDSALTKSVNTYVTDNSKAPFRGWNYRYLYRTQNYTGSSDLANQSIYVRDPANGNLVLQEDYLGSALYRKTYSEYLPNLDRNSYILNLVFRSVTVDTSNTVYQDTHYHYDNQIHTPSTLGNLTLKQVVLSGNTTQDISYSYDEYGNNTGSCEYNGYGTVNAAPSAEARCSTTTYDSDLHIYPVQTTNAAGETAHSNYLYTLGSPYNVTDANGWITTTSYDGLGRTLSVTPPGLTGPGIRYSYPTPSAGQVSAPFSIKMEIFDPQINDYRSVWGIYDGISRQIQSQVDAGGSLLISSTSFTAANQTFRQSNPISVSGTSGTYVDPGWAANTYTEYEYDALGRTTKVTAPGNIITATQYSGLVSTQTDPNGNKVKQTNDGLGRLSKVQDLTSGGSVYGTMIYAYDILGQLTKTTDAQNNQTKLTYDNLGRKIRMVDPDMGTWAYTYDSLGNLTQQTDARGKVLSFGYDSLHRLIQKAEQNSGTQTVLASYQYGTSAGNIGRRTQMTDGSGSTTWSYSNFGRDVSEQKTIGNVSNTSSTQSDWLGRNTSVTYPDGEVLTYQYDSLGRVQNVKSSSDPATTLADLAYNSLSQITGMNLKNGIHITNTYNDSSNQRLANRNAVVNSTTLIDFSYTYDAAGNITQLNDNKLHQVNTYTYDSLNRLKSAESSNNTDYQYRQKYDYDKVGNILQVSDWEKDIILKSDFEDATLADWSATVKDNNNLFTNDASAFAPALGAASLAVVVDDNNPVYVQDNSPANNTQYRARFFVNRNTLNMAVNDQFTLFQAKNASGGLVFGIDVNKSAAGYNLVLYSNTDANPASKPSTTIGLNDGWICLEVNWVAASGAGQNNGLVTLWRNGSMDASLTGLDNDTLSVDSVRLGAVEGVDTGTRGQFNLDALESRRYTYIGSLLPQIAGAVDNVVPVSYKSSTDNGIKVIGDVYYAQEPQDTPTETETPVPPATETPVPPTLPADSATPTSTDTAAVSDTPVPTQTNTVENSATFTSTSTATSSPTITISPTVTATATITPTPTITLTPTITPTLMLGEFVDGTGTDGDLNIAAGASFNLNTDASNGRSCPDGIAYNVSSLAGTLANLTEAPAAGCLGINDEVLLINLQGSTAYSENTGNYEFLRVKSISGASITFSSLKKHWYGDGMRSDSGIGTSAGNQKVMLMRVPNYNNVTVNGTLTASNWYGFNHGVIALRVKGTLAGTGSVNASTIGYRGYHPCGESYVEFGTCGYGGGGKGETRQNTGTHASGGSGAYANNGNPGDGSGAYAGLRYGDSALEKIYMGSAGGEGGVLHTYNKGDIDGGGGGYGGGIIFIGANVINFTSGGGNLASNGQNSDSGGADGAGGSILVEAKVISRMDISAIGGWTGTLGSVGRVVVHYVTSQANISSNPAANISLLGAKPTPTITPTIFTTPQWGNFGNGNDGELIVGASETFNIKTSSKSTSRACADGGDAVEYIVAGLSETSATLFNSPSNGCIKAGDEVMLINLQGVDAGYSNTGNYEFLRVGSVDANVVSFTTPKVNFYGQNSTDDSAIGMDAASQRVMMIRVPNYSHVSNSGTLTTNGWSPNQNSGIIVFRVSGTLEGNGTIYSNDHGFWAGGGGWGSGGRGNGGVGMTYVHDNAASRYGGGQGGGHASGSGGQGGGAGYKNNGFGYNAGRDGAGGAAYGDEKLNKLFHGSGGGGGGQRDGKKKNVAGGDGGTGGGIIFIGANTYQYSGSIISNGGSGGGGNGGSGSGGSIRLEGNIINVNYIAANSTTGNCIGSNGRIAIYYRTSFSGNAANAYL